MTDDPAVIAQLMPAHYAARPEQALLFTVTAWDTNCPQHIPRKVSLADAAAMLTARDARIAELEAELARVQKPQTVAAARSGRGSV